MLPKTSHNIGLKLDPDLVYLLYCTISSKISVPIKTTCEQTVESTRIYFCNERQKINKRGRQKCQFSIVYSCLSSITLALYSHPSIIDSIIT